jgi:hypothetical protein
MKLRFKSAAKPTNRAKKPSVPDVNALDEEDFAEFLRRGHAQAKKTFQQREDEQIEQARLEEEESIRKQQQQMKAEWQRTHTKKKTEEGLKREFEQAKRHDSRKRKVNAGYLDIYDDDWKKLQILLKSPCPEIQNVPWPTHERLPIPTLSNHSISDFLQLETLTSKERKKVIQRELLKFHPDKFARIAAGMANQDEAMEFAKQTTQILNNLSH